MSGRGSPEVESLIGPFVNLLPLRIQFSGRDSFKKLIDLVRETCLQAYANQAVPFELIVEKLRIPRDPGNNTTVPDGGFVSRTDQATVDAQEPRSGNHGSTPQFPV